MAQVIKVSDVEAAPDKGVEEYVTPQGNKGNAYIVKPLKYLPHAFMLQADDFTFKIAFTDKVINYHNYESNTGLTFLFANVVPCDLLLTATKFYIFEEEIKKPKKGFWTYADKFTIQYPYKHFSDLHSALFFYSDIVSYLYLVPERVCGYGKYAGFIADNYSISIATYVRPADVVRLKLKERQGHLYIFELANDMIKKFDNWKHEDRVFFYNHYFEDAEVIATTWTSPHQAFIVKFKKDTTIEAEDHDDVTIPAGIYLITHTPTHD